LPIRFLYGAGPFRERLYPSRSVDRRLFGLQSPLSLYPPVLQFPWGYGGSISGPEDDMTFEVGKLQLGLWAVAGLASTWYFLTRKRKFPVIIYLLSGISAGAMFLMIYKAKFVWDALAFMAYIQFPWRYLSLVLVTVALLSGSVIDLFKHTRVRAGTAMLLALLLITYEGNKFRPEVFLVNAKDSIYYTNQTRIQEHMSGIIPDFLPKTADNKLEETPLLDGDRLVFDQPVEMALLQNLAHKLVAQVRSTDEVELTARIFDFPGWTVYRDGVIIPHQTTEEGFISAWLEASAETAEIVIVFEETPLRQAANLTTMAGGAVALLALVPFGTKIRQRKKDA
jgi:hypothetical protein